MQILFSKYNLPFTELSTPDVHYISLDDQRAIRAGEFDAHVHAFRDSIPPMRLSLNYRTFRTSDVFEIFDPLSGITYSHDLSGAGFFIPKSTEPACQQVDYAFLDQLRKSRVNASLPAMVRCTCGNAKRPWRCTCHK